MINNLTSHFNSHFFPLATSESGLYPKRTVMRIDLPQFYYLLIKNIYWRLNWWRKRPLVSWRVNSVPICYLPAGRSVLGKTVPELQPHLKSQDRGNIFSNTDRPRPSYNRFFLCAIALRATFFVEFWLKPFSSNLAYACVWHFEHKKRYCLLCIECLHFTLFLCCNKKDWRVAKVGNFGAGRTRGQSD